jgi:hypothetical protein
MFNINEVVGVLKEEGFDLSFKSLFYGKYLGKEQKIPKQNFPQGLRLERSCNLMFLNGGKQL